MLVLLGAFTVLPLLLPWLVARIGARAFYVAALLPLAAFVQAAVETPAVLSGNVPFETYDWIPSLGIELSMRMDTLGWLMALIVTPSLTSITSLSHQITRTRTPPHHPETVTTADRPMRVNVNPAMSSGLQMPSSCFVLIFLRPRRVLSRPQSRRTMPISLAS